MEGREPKRGITENVGRIRGRGGGGGEGGHLNIKFAWTMKTRGGGEGRESHQKLFGEIV